jgi:hypothetical protein
MADARNNEVGATGWMVFTHCMVMCSGKPAAVIEVMFLSNVKQRRSGCVKILVSFYVQDNNWNHWNPACQILFWPRSWKRWMWITVCELTTVNMVTPRIHKIISYKWRENIYLSKIFRKHKINCVSLETFAATDFNEIFSGRQPRQDVKFSDVLGTNSFPIFRVCWWFSSTKIWWLSVQLCAKPPAHPKFGEGVSSRNVGKP